jgi:DNA-directed RNA polymerase subunit E'/Rpb7
MLLNSKLLEINQFFALFFKPLEQEIFSGMLMSQIYTLAACRIFVYAKF